MKNGTVSVFGEAIERIAKEQTHLIKLLQNSQKQYLSYVENVSKTQWNWKPGQNRWSLGETAEHILLTKGRLFSAMERAVAAPPNPDWEKSTAGKAELLERSLLDRSHKAVSPASIRPQGLSKAEVIRRFKEARAKTIKFVQDTRLPLNEHNSEHPFPVFNALNAYQWLLYIALHNLRHDRQIAEVKAMPDYPR